MPFVVVNEPPSDSAVTKSIAVTPRLSDRSSVHATSPFTCVQQSSKRNTNAGPRTKPRASTSLAAFQRLALRRGGGQLFDLSGANTGIENSASQKSEKARDHATGAGSPPNSASPRRAAGRPQATASANHRRA